MPIRLEGITLYTVKDIEELLGVGNSTVRRYIGEGRLKGTKMARRWYIPAENLLEYFRQSSMEPPAELLEKLQELEAKLDKKDKRPRRKISLARIASGRGRQPAEPAPAPAPPPVHIHVEMPSALRPQAEPSDPSRGTGLPAPQPVAPPPAPVESAPASRTAQPETDIERLLAQARRLKEEAARIEKTYVKDS